MQILSAFGGGHDHLLGLLNQFILLPAATLLVCRVWPPGLALLFGFMVIAVCPGSQPVRRRNAVAASIPQ